MQVKVKRLRAQGRRMSDNEIGRAPYVEGELRVYGLGSSIVASVSEPNNNVADPLLPSLYDVRLTTMHGSAMLLRGEERPQGESGPAYVQEWSVRLSE